MKLLSMFTMIATGLLPATAGLAQEGEVTAESLQQRLEGVAPPAVLENSTLVHVGEGGEMQTLREGTNGWTCMYPGTDPMCVDAGGFEWMQAMMGGEDPPDGNIGFAYMLLGDEGTSNIAPGATEETPDNEWVQTGPHVMIMGPGAAPMRENYPTSVPEDGTTPWVMWPETPYAHLMLPVE
jgi:hypothetical protein